MDHNNRAERSKPSVPFRLKHHLFNPPFGRVGLSGPGRAYDQPRIEGALPGRSRVRPSRREGDVDQKELQVSGTSAQTAQRSGATHLAGWVIALLIMACLMPVIGCKQLLYRINNDVPETFVPNPLELPPAEDAFVWSQVVDTVDDYFRIVREQPVQNSNQMILDGRIETSYRIGASIFEPWRKDSTSGFERLQSTLQSVRRRAIVTVRPQGGSYSIEVVVQKDLEDTDRTQFATESTTAMRHDGTVVRKGDAFDDSPQTLGWIPLGRDTSLEQAILRDIFGRITQPDSKHRLLPF